MATAGYQIIGTGSAKGGRHKIWWGHKSYRRVESIYNPDKTVVITAYHVD